MSKGGVANGASTGPALQARDLRKHFRMGNQDVQVLTGVSLDVVRGQWVAILGASGSGKSTLLHLLGGLDRPDGGEVRFEDRNVFSLSPRGLDQYRRSAVGFVFQFYHLLPELTALENVVIGAMIGVGVFAWPRARAEVESRAEQVLVRLGLSERLRHRPAKLSGGERQRVAIARALINKPSILLADEPTGNLDEGTGQRLLELFGQLHEGGQTIVMVTHDVRIADRTDRALTLKDGKLSQ